MAVLLLLATVLPASSAAHADEVRREPVILVHGWAGAAADMSAMRDAFTAAGRAAYTVDLPGRNNLVEHPDEPGSPLFIAAAPAAVGGTCPGTLTNLPITWTWRTS